MEAGYVILNVLLAELCHVAITWILLIDILLGVGVNVTLNKLIARYGRELAEHEVMQKP